MRGEHPAGVFAWRKILRSGRRAVKNDFPHGETKPQETSLLAQAARGALTILSSWGSNDPGASALRMFLCPWLQRSPSLLETLRCGRHAYSHFRANQTLLFGGGAAPDYGVLPVGFPGPARFFFSSTKQRAMAVANLLSFLFFVLTLFLGL